MEIITNSSSPEQGGKSGIIGMSIGLLVIGLIAGYFIGKGMVSDGVVQQTATPTAITMQAECGIDNSYRLSVINSFADTWSVFEKSIQMRPVLGSTTWSAPHSYQFLGNNLMLIAFEDGHVVVAAVVEYRCDANGGKDFVALKFYNDEYPFSETAWNDIRSQYGDSTYDIHTYTKQIFRNGSIVNYDTWTEVSENIFVGNSGVGWKSYTDEKYGFSLRYPVGVTLTVSKGDSQRASYSVWLKNGQYPVIAIMVNEMDPPACQDRKVTSRNVLVDGQPALVNVCAGTKDFYQFISFSHQNNAFDILMYKEGVAAGQAEKILSTFQFTR